jgi:hypothetical protein
MQRSSISKRNNDSTFSYRAKMRALSYLVAVLRNAGLNDEAQQVQGYATEREEDLRRITF